MSDMEKSDVTTDAAPAAEPVAPEQPEAPSAESASAPAVPVLAQVASSESPTQAPEVESEDDETPVSLEDAARAVVLFVKAHRTVGDADLGAALADLEAALDAQA